MKRNTIIDIISYAFVILFLYTAFSKLSQFELSLFDLRRSPMLGSYAEYLAVAVPSVEILISAMLLFPRTRLAGLVGSFVVMVVFTAYVSYLVFTQSNLPCTCGGIIRQLTWKQHFFFNVFFTLAAGTAIFLNWRGRKNLTNTRNEYQYS